MMKNDKYSVLMSVYYKEKPENLKASMESIFTQTIPTDDFVLVCDGPISKDLDNVIEQMIKKYGRILHVVRLEKKSGLGNALNEGIKYCKNELIARMDSDDIAYCNRCEKQLKVFIDMKDVVISSGIVEEFSSTPASSNACRVPPETQEEILLFARKRNPFNHPCVMYKKSIIISVGGYQDFYLLEDYYLWLRILIAGYQGYNLQEPLLWMRAGNDMYKRRAGWKYAKSQAALFRYMKRYKFISPSQCFKSSLIRAASSMAPNGLRKLLFEKVLRKQRRGVVL